MDGSDCHVGIEILAADVHVCLVLVQSRRSVAATIIRVSGSVDLAERAI